jgi:subtilisin-like proprotein convertase family protein
MHFFAANQRRTAMRNEFVNQTPMRISTGAPSTIESPIEVTGLGNAEVLEVEVRVNVTHTWTGDLRMILINPDGTEVLLVNKRGSFRDDFWGTVFRADAQTPIAAGRAPFRGTFRAEEDLAAFNGKQAGGVWRLKVEDTARRDGGALNQWSLGLSTSAVESKPFNIDVRFLGGLSPAQQDAFGEAAARWSEIITGDLPPAFVEGETIDDVLIEAQGANIDGPGRILGQAGPRFIRPASKLPVKGIMSFDTADLDQMESNGSLKDVILHEMGHVLGFGTLWSTMGLIVDAGQINPIFTGSNAQREYGKLRALAQGGSDAPTPVPVANTGGPGTRDGHWREAVFGDELLTGFLSGRRRPISAMSIAAFEDMGYQVAYGAADQFQLPNMLMIAELGLMGQRHRDDTCEHDHMAAAIILPPAAINV